MVFLCSKLSVDDSTTFTHIACGNVHFAAVSSTGALYMWGDNQNGQIPDSETPSVEKPVAVNLSNVNLVSCHGNHKREYSIGQVFDPLEQKCLDCINILCR